MPLLSTTGRRVPFALAALALTTVLTACGDSDQPPTTPTSSPSEVTVPVTAATVEVLDGGSEPREVLRMNLPVGTTQTATLVTQAVVSQQIDQQPAQDFSSPEITIPLSANVTADDPTAVVDLTLSSMTSPDATLQAALSGADGSAAGLSVTDSGAVTALRLKPSANSANAARAAIEQALGQAVYRTVALPDAPVGIGARWVVRQQVSSEILLDQTTTVTLTAREGNRLSLAVDVSQTPQSPVWNLAGDAGTLNIDQYVMAGSGNLTVDLSLPLPIDGQMTVGGDQAYGDPDSSSVIRQTISNSIRWES
ncbi:hypothetical protein BKP42_19480 [Rhodococcus erythropolis]|uniref:hypothetical protein n=1 Tax=Rhodococcus erythropolis TaxID=1833 RepID=UPI000BB3051B|nr:hypothetical protein [Rhodococcus erythropolis]PBI99285.1 hypothetical protein BKP42_19480 [Rhodococcus erythropolis]